MSPVSPAYVRLVRASGWYDLIVTAGFASPWTYALVHRLLSAAGDAVGLGTMPALTPLQTLYANLMGSVVLVWSVLRVVRPLPLHGLLDGTARVLFSLWQAYALAHGGPGVLWPFLVLEVSFGIAQLAPWARAGAGGLRETCQGS
ncbi:hypothetical protein AQI95_40160 [Streptomyces yokosukanensis]|uniref:Uncharacterized protein n=1 Tax=Streptomyces yokosukanensis TaxID=67386 RepID=A0A101NTV6_9ACTN|nr:hypothetical protein [Streptomyces yokosukanensis]KUM99251.1 hypothetical protein AQI95_40160 [Streptomyces yokosukanensis]